MAFKKIKKEFLAHVIMKFIFLYYPILQYKYSLLYLQRHNFFYFFLQKSPTQSREQICNTNVNMRFQWPDLFLCSFIQFVKYDIWERKDIAVEIANWIASCSFSHLSSLTEKRQCKPCNHMLRQYLRVFTAVREPSTGRPHTGDTHG